MTPITVSTRIDTSGLNAGLDAARSYSKRTLPQLVNTAAYWVAVNAKSDMPFVTPEKIDQELSVITHPVIGKRGKALKNKKTYSGGAPPGEAPLAALIIQARARVGSNYNVLTNHRYALAKSPFKGVSRSAGRAAMAMLIDRMIKLRHKSGKFILAGWIPVIQKLMPYSAQKFMRGGPKPMERRANPSANLGAATPAQEGWRVTASIENDVGLEGVNRASMNRALMLYGAGPLQDAIDREGEKQMDYALKHFEKELADETNKHWK